MGGTLKGDSPSARYTHIQPHGMGGDTARELSRRPAHTRNGERREASAAHSRPLLEDRLAARTRRYRPQGGDAARSGLYG